MSWHHRFFDPIILPGRKPLVTLRDAARYITKLPKTEHDADEWQAAMQALLLVAEHGGRRCSPGSASRGRSIVRLSAYSIPRARTSIGDAES